MMMWHTFILERKHFKHNANNGIANAAASFAMALNRQTILFYSGSLSEEGIYEVNCKYAGRLNILS